MFSLKTILVLFLPLALGGFCASDDYNYQNPNAPTKQVGPSS